jgi:predicted nucleic acid-binding protein
MRGVVMQNEIFLDTAYLIALSSVNDELHTQASLLRQQIKAPQRRLVTTHAVLLELGNALAKLRFRSEAIRLLQAFEVDPNIQIVALTEDLYGRALALYSSRTDKEWGLVDCISFVVMQDRGIYEALTSDEHFQQAGFVRLLQP